MSHERLRPQAERTLRRTAARRVERDERVQQKRHVVAAHVEIALVNIGHVRQRVQVLNLRTVGIMYDAAILAIRKAKNFFQRLAVGVLDNGVVEFLAADHIDDLVLEQRLFRQDAHVRTDKRNLDIRIGVLNRFRQADIAGESGRAREKNQQLVVLTNANGLFRRNVVRRSIQQARSFEHARGIREPDRIPVGLDFARGRPARTRASIEVFKRRRIQK